MLAGRVSVVRRVGGGAHATVYRIVALVVGLAIGTALAQTYVQETNVYDTIYQATVGSAYGATAVLAYAAPLTLTALAFAVGYKLRLWNLGAEGQLFMGAWAATGIAFTFPGIPGPLLIALMIVASAIAGAIWVLLPALARVYLGVTEVVTTLMLNFVAILWVTYFAFHVWPAPGTPLATTADLPERIHRRRRFGARARICVSNNAIRLRRPRHRLKSAGGGIRRYPDQARPDADLPAVRRYRRYGGRFRTGREPSPPFH